MVYIRAHPSAGRAQPVPPTSFRRAARQRSRRVPPSSPARSTAGPGLPAARRRVIRRLASVGQFYCTGPAGRDDRHAASRGETSGYPAGNNHVTPLPGSG
jgi:hypothetical protein